MADPIIQIQNLSYAYPKGQQVLKNISLEVYEGEYLAIMGANGAGKTTLCLFLNGVIPNVLGGRITGNVRVCGLDTFTHHVYEIAQTVGLVLQDPEAQLFSADVASEVAFAAENRGIAREEIQVRLEEVLNIVRLEGMEDRLSDELSGGQKQRLAIAANMIVRPKVLVADEPTSQLDPIGKDQVFGTLHKLKQDHGITVVIASHCVDEIVRYADRVIVLNQGEIFLDGPPESVFREVERLNQINIHAPAISNLGHILGINGDNPLHPNVNDAAKRLVVWREERTPHSIEIAHQKVLDTKKNETITEDIDDEVLPSRLDIAISVRNLTFSYPNTEASALVDLSFDIPAGQFVGVIGQNGAGKTTLMKCFVGLIEPSAGEIFINGNTIANQGVMDIAKQVGLILQNPDTQLFRMSVEDEIRFGLENLGLDESEISQRIDDAITITGMEEFREIYPFKLSLGDRRKVAVAAIVSMKPQILIFDEPLTGQDYKGRYELCSLAASFNQQGHTIVMITHDMELVAKYTERTLVMGDGNLLLDAPTREVFDHIDILRSTFIEPPEIVRLAQALKPYGLPSGLLTVEEVADALLRIEPLITNEIMDQ